MNEYTYLILEYPDGSFVDWDDRGGPYSSGHPMKVEFGQARIYPDTAQSIHRLFDLCSTLQQDGVRVRRVFAKVGMIVG